MSEIAFTELLRPPTFGYQPDFERLQAAFDIGEFPRAVILDTAVREITDNVEQCRVLWDCDVQLPEGLYWFQGVQDGDLLMQVGSGVFPGDATVVPVHDLTDQHPLISAWTWAEKFWESATPVPEPRFRLQESAVTRHGDSDVVIVGRKFLKDSWSYTVLADGLKQDIVESGLNPRPLNDDPRSWVQGDPTPAARFGATLTRAKLEGKFANTLFSFRATRTTFRPYQFKPVLKLLETGKARLLIADEVGLGKTIEAGLIWTELEARSEADRVLIVCPSSLVSKWIEEMEERFEFELVELDSSNLEKFLSRHKQNQLPRRHAHICSLERLRIWKGLEDTKNFPPAFDLVIVDEAHAMRNSDTKSYALGTELSEWADNLVFLTATPINLRQEDLLNLLELLAPEDYGDLADLELRLEPNRVINTVGAKMVQKGVKGTDLLHLLTGLQDFPLGKAMMERPDFALLAQLLERDELGPREIVEAKRFLADLNALSTVVTRTKKVEVNERNPKRTERRKEVVWTPVEEEFYSEYRKWCAMRADDMNSNIYFAMQMPLRLASACLPMARAAVLDPEGFGDLEDADEGKSAGRLEPHSALVAAAQNLPEEVDSKFDLLYETVRSFRDQKRRAILFTHSRPALSYLERRLQKEFRVAVMHGGVSRQRRRQLMAEFRAGAYDLLLANRVASEGLDFEFCSAVINYDLPWNPMEIEQRIGRIDRIGQQEETILIVNFVNNKTIDERIMIRLLDRIKIFESSIGSLEPIISDTAPKLLKAGFDFTLTESQREQKFHEALTALEEQRKGLKDITDASSSLLVANDVKVAGLEEDLLRTGRYIGQRELALLLDDWARVDGALPLEFAQSGLTVNMRGNAAMAARVDELTKKSLRTRAETSSVSSQLRNEMAMTLVLDQEHARTHGGMLLTSTSPLTMAAISVPGHRHARFASLRISARAEESQPGTFVVVLAKAVSASRGGDEIWGAAVELDGRNAHEGPVNALLAALAEGRMEDARVPELDRLSNLADRALNLLHLRHVDEQARRDREFHALQHARSATLKEQHDRKVTTITTRINTAMERRREFSVIALFEAQKRRAEERFEALSEQLKSASQPEIRLEPLAACILQVTAEGEA